MCGETALYFLTQCSQFVTFKPFALEGFYQSLAMNKSTVTDSFVVWSVSL